MGCNLSYRVVAPKGSEYAAASLQTVLFWRARKRGRLRLRFGYGSPPGPMRQSGSRDWSFNQKGIQDVINGTTAPGFEAVKVI